MCKKIESLIERVVYGNDTEWAMNYHAWDWVPGVGMYGILHGAYILKNDKYKAFVEKWITEHIDNISEDRTVNSTAPFLAVIEYCRMYGNEEWLEKCIDWAEWIVTEAPLTKDGGFEHTVTEGDDFAEQMWADTLFMACIFLTKLGELTGETKYIDVATQQVKKHYEYLQDKEKNLFYHGWDGKNRDHMSAAFWGRANGWIAYATPVILEAAGDFEGKDDIVKCYDRFVQELEKLQLSDGMFRTVLDMEESYPEASATAALGLGVKKMIDLGLCDAAYKKIYTKALYAVEKLVNDSGELEQVSTGTPVLWSREQYNDVPICPTLYGQGLGVLILAEEANCVE